MTLWEDIPEIFLWSLSHLLEGLIPFTTSFLYMIMVVVDNSTIIFLWFRLLQGLFVLRALY